ncbi:MAG: hypothetical protein ABR985_01475 [Methanotrichaceae archaeon]|jgi:hypothetical protein
MADEKKKLIGVYDPSAFVRADGSLDTNAFVDAIWPGIQAQIKKVDSEYQAKKAEAEKEKKDPA